MLALNDRGSRVHARIHPRRGRPSAKAPARMTRWGATRTRSVTATSTCRKAGSASGLREPGPFVSAEVLRRPDGTLMRWHSRSHRKRPAGSPNRSGIWWRPDRLSWWIGVLFAIGSSCFLVAAVACQVSDPIGELGRAGVLRRARSSSPRRPTSSTPRRSTSTTPLCQDRCAAAGARPRGSRAGSTGSPAPSSSAGPSPST